LTKYIEFSEEATQQITDVEYESLFGSGSSTTTATSTKKRSMDEMERDSLIKGLHSQSNRIPFRAAPRSASGQSTPPPPSQQELPSHGYQSPQLAQAIPRHLLKTEYTTPSTFPALSNPRYQMDPGGNGNGNNKGTWPSYQHEYEERYPDPGGSHLPPAALMGQEASMSPYQSSQQLPYPSHPPLHYSSSQHTSSGHQQHETSPPGHSSHSSLPQQQYHSPDSTSYYAASQRQSAAWPYGSNSSQQEMKPEYWRSDSSQNQQQQNQQQPHSWYGGGSSNGEQWQQQILNQPTPPDPWSQNQLPLPHPQIQQNQDQWHQLQLPGVQPAIEPARLSEIPDQQTASQSSPWSVYPGTETAHIAQQYQSYPSHPQIQQALPIEGQLDQSQGMLSEQQKKEHTDQQHQDEKREHDQRYEQLKDPTQEKQPIPIEPPEFLKNGSINNNNNNNNHTINKLSLSQLATESVREAEQNKIEPLSISIPSRSASAWNNNQSFMYSPSSLCPSVPITTAIHTKFGYSPRTPNSPAPFYLRPHETLPPFDFPNNPNIPSEIASADTDK